MTTSRIVGSAAADTNRRRKAHTKSRRGCSGCKTRRVKCDEKKPACQQCKDFGVSCTYGGNAAGLTFAGESSFDLNDSFTCHNDRPITVRTRSVTVLPRLLEDQRLSQASAIIGHCRGLPSPPDSDAEEVQQKQVIGMAALEMLHRFNERTVLSVGTTQVAKLYQKEVFHLACSYPFLASIVTTLTLLHDRHLSGTDAISRTTLSHWYHGTAKFKETLMQPLKNETRDALWASASLLGVIQFASFEARTPEEAWPLRPPHPTDLDWLKMSDGKKAVFAITDPLRADSVFRTLSVGHDRLFCFMNEPHDYFKEDAIDLTGGFTDIFDLGPTSSGHANPYYKSAMIMARLLHTPCDRNNILEFFGFIMHMDPELKVLLEQKDAKALLLVVYWYAKLYRSQWWLHRRGLMEGRAVCMYLDMHHGDDKKLQRMLEWPKAEFGIEKSLPGRTSTYESPSNAATVLCVV